MATQSVSGNRYSASSLGESLAKLNKLTSDYGDRLLEIKEAANNLSSKELKGCSNCDAKLVKFSRDSNGNENDVYHWVATGIKYSTDNLSGMVSTVNALIYYIQKFEDTYGALDGTDDILENLACQIEKYQNDINNTLSGETKKNALKGMIGVVFASNKYDAKSKNGISENKVSTDLENWDGDLKFERQDNGTYLVIKVGKDGSEVPMGYTTKEGKNAYYKEAKEKVLGSSKENNTSSNEKTTSSNENNTSDSNSKSDSTSDNYVSSSDISNTIYQNNRSKWFGAGALSDGEKILVSEQMASDMKDEGHTASELEGYVYNYRTKMEGGKKVVYVEAAKVVSNEAYDFKTTDRKFTAKYYLNTLKNRR